jgi:hypothetical protein
MRSPPSQLQLTTQCLGLQLCSHSFGPGRTLSGPSQLPGTDRTHAFLVPTAGAAGASVAATAAERLAERGASLSSCCAAEVGFGACLFAIGKPR